MVTEYTKEYEVSHVHHGRPHVVLLGAGASRAAFPDGDRDGRKLPLLEDLVEIAGLEGLMMEADIQPPFSDFEAIYSRIALDSNLGEVRGKIDQKVYNYFDSLKLPDRPTLYDHLVLSLRPKDVIATFNWDPLLFEACRRNHRFTDVPQVLFLHGSVALGRCDYCKRVSPKGFHVCNCGRSLQAMPILFPVIKKNYNADPAIAAHWQRLQAALSTCWAFTIFGYSAPQTDVDARTLLKQGWGNINNRSLEEVEIIDVRAEEELCDSWDEFIHTHHYTVKNDFDDSWIAQHPRRSCEAIWAQNMDAMFIQPFPVQKTDSFDELYASLQPRIDAEREQE